MEKLLYHAEWALLGDGVCRQARKQVHALAKAGIRVGLTTIRYSEADAPQSVRDEVRPYLVNGSRLHSPIAIRQTVIHDAGYLQNLVNSKGVAARDSIVATWWERDRVDPQIIDVLRSCAELWVTCERNRMAFVGSGLPPDKVAVVPFPLTEQPRANTSPAPGKRFYHIGKWEPRKAHHELIGAFLLEFAPTEDATLTIQTRGFGKWNGYPTIEASVAHWKRDRAVAARGWTDALIARAVRVSTNSRSDAEIRAMHEQNNIYVSASHGEALDIPALEAKLSGNRLVHVGFGGSEDYAEPEDPSVPWRPGPVHPGYRWEAGACWAVYEPAALRKALRQAEPRCSAEPVGTLVAYSAEAVGALMRERITQLLQKRDRSGAALAGVLH